MTIRASCKRCGKLLVLESAPDCPPEFARIAALLTVCDPCAALLAYGGQAEPETVEAQFEREWNSQVEWKRQFMGMTDEDLALEKELLWADFQKLPY